MTSDAPAAPQTRGHRPAAGVGWMLPVYDPMTAALGITHVYRRLLAHADIHPGDRVLDIGCGTGTLTVLAKQVHSQASVTGLDPDSAALDRARAKARARGLAVHFDVGYGGALPYPTGAFDRVLSSFMAHHLLGEERQKTLAEVLRVLTATGSLHLVDFGRGDDLAAALQQTGFTVGTLTRGRALLAAPVTIIDTAAP